MIVLDRATYADLIGEPVEAICEPIPQIAPAFKGVTLRPFALALPQGNGWFSALFANDGSSYAIDSGAVRFGLHKPVFVACGETIRIDNADLVLKWRPRA